MKDIIQRIESLGGSAALSGKTDISDDVLSRILNGSRGISSSELDSIAAALDTSVHWILTGKPDPLAVVFAGAGCSYPFSD